MSDSNKRARARKGLIEKRVCMIELDSLDRAMLENGDVLILVNM